MAENIENRDVLRIEREGLEGGNLRPRQLGFQKEQGESNATDMKMVYQPEAFSEKITFTPNNGAPTYSEVEISKPISDATNNRSAVTKKYVDDKVNTLKDLDLKLNGFVTPEEVKVQFDKSTSQICIIPNNGDGYLTQEYYVNNKRYEFDRPLKETLPVTLGKFFVFLEADQKITISPDWIPGALPIVSYYRQSSASLDMKEHFILINNDYHGTSMGSTTKHFVNMTTGLWIESGCDAYHVDDITIKRDGGILVNDDVRHEIPAIDAIEPTVLHMKNSEWDKEVLVGEKFASNWVSQLSTEGGTTKYQYENELSYENAKLSEGHSKDHGTWFLYFTHSDARASLNEDYWKDLPQITGESWSDIVIPLNQSLIWEERYNNLEDSIRFTVDHYIDFAVDWKVLGLVFISNGAIQEYINLASKGMKDLLHGTFKASTSDINVDGAYGNVVITTGANGVVSTDSLRIDAKGNAFGNSEGVDPKSLVNKGYLDYRIGSEVSTASRPVPSYDQNGNLSSFKRLKDGADKAVLEVNEDGTVSAPTCENSNITHDDDLITLSFLQEEMSKISVGGLTQKISVDAPLLTSACLNRVCTMGSTISDSDFHLQAGVCEEVGKLTVAGIVDVLVVNRGAALSLPAGSTVYAGNDPLSSDFSIPYVNSKSDWGNSGVKADEYAICGQLAESVVFSADNETKMCKVLLNITQEWDKDTGAGTGTGDPIIITTPDDNTPAQVIISGAPDTTYNGLYTYDSGQGYYKKGLEEKYIVLFAGGAVWGIINTINITVWNDAEYFMNSISVLGKRWHDKNHHLLSGLETINGTGASYSPSLDASGDIAVAGIVHANQVAVDNFINMRYEANSQTAILESYAAGSTAYQLRHTGLNRLQVNSNGTIEAPTSDTMSIEAANNKVLVTKEYMNQKLGSSGGGSVGSKLTYGFARMAWTSSGSFGPNGSNDRNGNCSHIVLESGTIKKLSYFFEGHNTSGAIQISVNDTLITTGYSAPSIPSGIDVNGIISGINIPVVEGDRIRINVVGGGQCGQVTLIVEG